MKDKTVVITGATSGLGKATALQIAQKGALVIIIARNSSKADALIDNIAGAGGIAQSVIADLSSMVDTKKAADRIKKVAGRIDVLINNAGAHFPEYKETSDGFEQTLALNYLSPFLLTHHLMEQIDQTAYDHGEARIINISSIMHKSPIKWDDLNFKKSKYRSTIAYYQSKHMITSFTYYLSRKLKQKNITVNCIHPGFVNTAIAQSDYPFPMNLIVPIVGVVIGESPEQAADTPVWLASADEAKGITGEYFHHRRSKKSWPPTKDEDAQERLFRITQDMLGKWLT